MAKFAENRKLYGSNSRVTKKSRGTATVDQVLNVVAQPTGHFITVRKSDMREPVTGRLVARKLTKVEDLLTPEEFAMYTELCALANA